MSSRVSSVSYARGVRRSDRCMDTTHGIQYSSCRWWHSVWQQGSHRNHGPTRSKCVVCVAVNMNGDIASRRRSSSPRDQSSRADPLPCNSCSMYIRRARRSQRPNSAIRDELCREPVYDCTRWASGLPILRNHQLPDWRLPWPTRTAVTRPAEPHGCRSPHRCRRRRERHPGDPGRPWRCRTHTRRESHRCWSAAN